MAAPNRSDNSESNRRWRLSGMGVELAAMVVVGGVGGILIDVWLDCSPWGLLVGACLGVTIGMIHFIRRAMLLNRKSAADYRRSYPKGVAPLPDDEDKDEQ